jgi:hypothetical protein
VNKADQLAWEARLRRPAAYAAIAAAVLGLVSFVVTRTIFEDRPRTGATPDAFLSINEAPNTLIGGTLVGAVATLLLVLVFYFLFRATIHRTPTIPRWFVYLIFAGPPLYAIAQVIGAFDQVDVAEQFVNGDYSFPDADPDEQPNLRECPAIRGELGDACADELAQENRDSPNPALVFLSLAGPILVAFLFVMLPLRARRAGLLSPFMGILGVLSGVLLVLPVLPPVILQAFWLGALGALFLGRWPGGPGPAWATGEADPWPSPARRRGLMGAREDAATDEADVEPDGTLDPEPPPERPSSRKRKRR